MKYSKKKHGKISLSIRSTFIAVNWTLFFCGWLIEIMGFIIRNISTSKGIVIIYTYINS